jgi:type IV secretion system protein TrbL
MSAHGAKLPLTGVSVLAVPAQPMYATQALNRSLGGWNNLARIVFESFAGLGLKASGTGMSTADLLSPGRVAQVGIDAGRPILDSISGLMGYISFFENFVQIVVLLFAWIVVLLAFFILAIQLFVTLIEFKLTTLAGFVLIPFGLFGKTAFAAERVLGNVISSGVKVLVLAVIVGIGSTLFSQFTAGFGGNQGFCAEAGDMPTTPAASTAAQSNRSVRFATGLFVRRLILISRIVIV